MSRVKDINRLFECIRSYRPRVPPENVNAAVNVILRCNRGVVEVLLIRRVTNPKDPWSGDIAFPGGRMEEEDKDFLETALRETFEEVGIPKDKLEVIGVLDLAYTLAGVKYNVAPVVSRLKDEVPLNLGNEVEKAFWMPLSPMEEKKVIHPLRGVMVRAYIYEGEIIWGMTKRILDKLLEVYRECLKRHSNTSPH